MVTPVAMKQGLASWSFLQGLFQCLKYERIIIGTSKHIRDDGFVMKMNNSTLRELPG